MNDHDLLIRVDEKLTILLNDRTDHEKRLRRLETWGTIALGVVYALQIYLNYVK